MIDLEQVSDQAQLYFDKYVIDGSDDELFASGYLRGHVDLVLGGAIVNQQVLSMEQFVTDVEASINKAIKAGELQQNDVEVVSRILNDLISSLA